MLSSVRQGDPLAPLIFILVLDVLHCGIEEICLRDGHGVDLGGGVRLASMGYADDTAIVADSDEGIRALHEWVRGFFGAHAFKINSKKTKYICSVDPAGVECLHGVDGIAHISPLPSCTSFRYLGGASKHGLYVGRRGPAAEKAGAVRPCPHPQLPDPPRASC